MLLISAHQLGIYGPSLDDNTITRFGQRTLLSNNPKRAFLCMLPMIAMQTQARAKRSARLLSTVMTSICSPFRDLPPLCLNVLRATRLAAGATLREHKHPFVRNAYVLTGTLAVTNTETGHSNVYKAGDFVSDSGIKPLTSMIGR